MRCPNCGHWNRASFPRCFRCGAPLPQQDAEGAASSPAPDAGPAGKIYIQVDEEGRATPAMDERDRLAQEMKELAARKRKGEKEQLRLRETGLSQGFAPTGRAVQTLTGRTGQPLLQKVVRSVDGQEAEGDVRPDAIPVTSRRVIDYDEYGDGPVDLSAGKKRKRYSRMTRPFGFSRFFRALAVLLILGGAGMASWHFVLEPYLASRNKEPLQERVEITPSILDDMPAHLVRIPGEEGQSIRIREMKQSYLVVGGYATFEVPDYRWYENAVSVTQETVMATLTPYLQTGAGEETPLEKISYEVEIPLSPLTLVSPSSLYTEVSTALYQIVFQVAENSTVYIYTGEKTEANKQDLSDLVNTQSGSLSLNVSVAAIGNNDFTIVTRAQYYRENSMTLTLYRAPQQIRLDLARDIATRYNPSPVDSGKKDSKGNPIMVEPNLTVKGTTVSWATIEVLSPYANLDTTRLASDGSFSFEAVFDHYGDNVIEIHASAPGFETSVVRHTVYYVPVAAIYTRRAWDMNVQYTDYLNNSQRRIANTQIYLCEGTITQILSEKPAMAIMSLAKNPERTVLLTNYSNDTWVVGTKYRIFADAYGLYNGAPWLSGRYTYTN